MTEIIMTYRRENFRFATIAIGRSRVGTSWYLGCGD